MSDRGLHARRVVAGPVGMVVAFLVVHAVLGWIDASDTGQDVDGVYRYWIDFWHRTGVLVGIDTPWVYPIAAILPMLAASVAGDHLYAVTWQVLVTALDAGAVVLLARRSMPAAWWWLAFTACLGPIALDRIDAIALPFALVGVLFLDRRPALAGAALAFAAWIKVWPVAIVAAALVAGRQRARVVAGAAVLSVLVLGTALSLGAGSRVLSFVGAQTGRGLQIEAPVSALWLWQVALGIGDARIYYDQSILTFQIAGSGVAAAAAVMTPLMAAAAVAVCALGVVQARRGADVRTVVALTALGLVTVAIALNKVGSPQYFTWFAAPVVLGMLLGPRVFRVPAGLALVLAALTQVIYPWFYDDLLLAHPWMLVVIDVRDVLEFVVLGWAIHALLATVPPAAAGPPADAPGTLEARRSPIG